MNSGFRRVPTALPSPVLVRPRSGRGLDNSSLKAAYDAVRKRDANAIAAEDRCADRVNAGVIALLDAVLGRDPVRVHRSACGRTMLRVADGGGGRETCSNARVWVVVEVSPSRADADRDERVDLGNHPITRTTVGEGLRRRPIPVDGVAAKPVEHARAAERDPLTPKSAAALGLVSKATIYRLLKTLPAEIMLGSANRSARWSNRASFEAWLADAAMMRRTLAVTTPPRAPTKRGATRPPVAHPEMDGPLDIARRRLLSR